MFDERKVLRAVYEDIDGKTIFTRLGLDLLKKNNGS